MAAETLLSSVSSNGAGSGAPMSGPCSVQLTGSSVMDGAQVFIQVVHTADTTADYTGVGFAFTSPGWQTINILGAYYIRCFVAEAGTDTDLTVEAIN